MPIDFPRLLNVDVVDFEETREIHRTVDIEGNVVEMRPIPGSDRAFLNLRLPNGTVVRAEVPHADFETHVYPAMGPPINDAEPVAPVRLAPTAWARLRLAPTVWARLRG